MSIKFDNKVVIVTGAGNGLGRSHALEFARRGARVVINDLGTDCRGGGTSSAAALEVVETIERNGGEAIANGANVAKYDEVQAMVIQAMEKWGRIDVLVNNAGILRDSSFAKMSIEDFQLVVDIHLMGSVNCSKAVWEIMKEQKYGRIIMTSSSSGLYGNFGQSNYGAAKMAVVGLMNTLVLEGARYNIHVNTLAPTAATRMTEGLIDEDLFKLMTPRSVTAGLLALCHEDSPNRYILCAGAGGYASTHIYETDGIFLQEDSQTPENILQALDQIDAREDQQELTEGRFQTEKFLRKASAK